MEYIYEFAGFLILIFIIVFSLKKYYNSKSNNNAEIKIKNRPKTIRIIKKISENLALGNDENFGGIISKKTTPSTFPKEKIAKWVITNSYEDDIKENLDISPVIQENEEEMKKIIIKPLILLVDDSLVVRKYVGDLLRANNYDLVIKTDGWEAITYLNSNSQKPDLIITDIQMPNMDGFQLIEAVRKEKKFNRVPIIVISAHVEANDHLVLMEKENIQGFIRKPFEDADLTVQAKYLLNNF